MTEAAKLITLARFIARRKVKEAMRANGIKPLEMEPSEINRAANVLLEYCRMELLAEARTMLSR